MRADADTLEVLEELGVVSIMTVPLLARGRALGVLTFVAAESGRRYSASDLALAEEIGRRAAIAIDNAHLYQQAQRAIQARQDVLSIVSHDLKNPLNSILMATALLDATAAREAGVLEKRVGIIQRSAQRMNRLIDDLLDIAGLHR